MTRPPPGNRGVLRVSSSPTTVDVSRTMDRAPPSPGPHGRRPKVSKSCSGADDLARMKTNAINATPMSNRRRLATLAAMNSSIGSLRSENSADNPSPKEGRNRGRGKDTEQPRSGTLKLRSLSPPGLEDSSTVIAEKPEKPSSFSSSSRRKRESGGSRSSKGGPSRSRSKSRGRGKVTEHPLSGRGKQRSLSPPDSEESSIVTAENPVKTISSSSRRRRGSGGSRSKGGQSRSRSKSRGSKRSTSLNARERLRRSNPNTRTTSSSSKNSSSAQQSPRPVVSPVSPAQPRSAGNHSRLKESLLSAPLTVEDSSTKKKDVSETELRSFLTTSERGERTVIPLEKSSPPQSKGSERQECTSPQQRGRERTFVPLEKTTSSSDRSSPRERERRGEASGGRTPARPPRTSRGVPRSKSNGPISSQRSRPRPSGSSRTGRSAPNKRDVERSKSTDDMDLNKFFGVSSTVSRRKKPSSGSRSVVSMPASALRNKNRLRNSKSDDTDTTKPPSSRSTITDDEGSGPEEDDSIDDVLDAPRGGHNEVTAKTSDQRTMESALLKHMSRTNNLLFDIFPEHIAEALQEGRKVEPENHELVTIFFSDIVGFTDISSELDPLKISDLLDRLYSGFDALSHYHDVFKVETIGDAYMAVTNLTKAQPDHVKRIAEFAVDAVRVANQTLIDKDNPKKGFVNIRVGFHSGPVVSNVVGSRNPRYCLFGDTVNTASRMESNSAANRIHCSEPSADLLKEQHPNLGLNPRGVIQVKGKGDMKTFWVNEEEAAKSQRNGSSRSIFKLMGKRMNRRGSM